MIDNVKQYIKLKQSQHLYKKTIGKSYGYLAFCDLFARVIEPRADFSQDVYQIVQDHFQHFILKSTKEKLFLLEASPRLGKSLLVSTLGAAYLLMQGKKGEKVLLVTASASRKKAFYEDLRTLLKSPFFLDVTGYSAKDFNFSNVEYIANTKNKSQIILKTTNSESPIGTGYHWIIFDDFLTYECTMSKAKSTRANDKVSSLLSRTEYEDGKGITKLIVANQRLNFNDLSARFIRSWNATN